MEDKSKHNLNQFIKKLQYHGAIQRMNDITGRYNEKVSLNVFTTDYYSIFYR